MEKFSEYWDIIIKSTINFLPSVFLAIAVLIVGLWVIKRIVSLTKKMMIIREVDTSLQDFLLQIISVSLKILLIISVVSIIGVATSSFIAILASAGFAIGMALQGSLGNFAGGIIILLFKPYKVGDYIEVQGFSGTVKSIQIFNTILLTVDNKRVLIPNGIISNGSIVNYTAEEKRRIDFLFGISYSDNIDKVKEIIRQLIDEDKRILDEPEPLIVVSGLADSSVNLTVRVWSKTEDYWDIYFDLQEKVKKAFDKNNISIPYPQTDVHLFQH